MKGKLPGNLDIVFRILACQKTGYMMDVFAELFEEYKATTINLRVLWVDKVRSVPYLYGRSVFRVLNGYVLVHHHGL